MLLGRYLLKQPEPIVLHCLSSKVLESIVDLSQEPTVVSNVSRSGRAVQYYTTAWNNNSAQDIIVSQGSVLGIKKNIPNTVSVLGILSLIPFRY